MNDPITTPTTDPNDAWLKLHIVDGYTVAEAIQTTEQSKSADKQTTAGDLFRALLAEGRRVRAAASGREITHVLLAQRVALVERLPDGMCRVEFCDGSIGTVEAEDMVSVEAVRAEGLP